ncbi:MAG: glycosyl hydrolase family 95 catalytic domain-containing protein, partial [Candidatus Coproplasma sp.]
YDTIKEAALFWVDNLVTDTRDGTLVSSPSYSPEHGPFSLGTSADQSLIWELFRNTIELAEAKGDNSSEIEEIKTSMSRLSMPKIGLAGQYQEWKDEIQLDITGDNHHRHTNHLVGLFPGTYVVPGRSEQDDAFAAAIKETLNVRGDTDVGWAFAWRTVIYSKLNDGEKAFKEYSKLIRGNGKRQAVGDNLFDVYTAVSPVLFQIDANLGGVSGVAEMLLSSTNYVIKPLAALPNVWKDGAYTGLRARGDFTVDAAWSDGTLDKMSVLSGSGEDCTVDCSDFETASVTCGGKKVAYTKNADGTITFKTEIGKNYVITNGNGNVIIDGGDEVVKGLSGGAIAGICIGGAAVAAGGTTGVVFLCRKRRNKTSK